MASLNHRCARIQTHIQGHLVRLTVDLFQSFPLHLQLYSRIPLEDLRVTLAKQLHHPFVGDAARAESRR
jgi:hypothetical protein